MILAAGQGIRLRPLTLERPKSMLSVAGQPLLEYSVAWLRHYGIRQIGINLHYRPQVVVEHFGDGSAFGVEIRYSVEDRLLGTAGGAKKLSGFIEAPCVVVYGDVLTDLDLATLIDFHASRDRGSHLTMVLYRVPNPAECGIVGLNGQGQVAEFVEKPPPDRVFSNLANAGVMIVDQEILDHIPAGRFYDFGHDLFPRLLQVGIPLYGWALPPTAYLIDIGTPEKFERVQREWPTAQACGFLS